MAYDSEVSKVSQDVLILQRARDRIAAGWCQLKYGLEGNGPSCATGALVLAGMTNVSHFNVLLGFDGSSGEYLTVWNDYPGRTQAEVLERFDSAISRLASGSEGG